MDLEVKVCFSSVSLCQDVLCKMRHMFDLTEKRPAYWGPLEASSLRSTAERELTNRRTGKAVREVQSYPNKTHNFTYTTILVLVELASFPGPS